MFPNKPSHSRSQRRAQRGQSIIVALLVLLLLGLAGALFVTIVARNVLNAAHASRVLTADQYAHAGITFADAQLSSSLDGADWRPPLQNTLAVLPTGARELGRYNAAVTANLLSAPGPNDPDLKYLQAGFARYNTGAGRFLLRLTYDPVNIGNATVPSGKYIKIESIGREGVIDSLDPTTYTNNRSSDRLQAYQVAFKPIGITDYARFETNPDKRSDTANMGVTSRYSQADADGGIITSGVYDLTGISATGATLVPYPILTTYGAADAYQKVGGVLYPNPTAGKNTTIAGGASPTVLAGGGSIHANMPVRFFGKNVVYLNDAGINAPLYQDSVEIAGDLSLNGYQPGTKLDNSNSTLTSGQRSALILNPPDLATLKSSGTFIVPSNDNTSADGPFSTHNGLVRDSSMQNDATGFPRGIGRLEPPQMDAQETGSRLPRYKALAMLSPPRKDSSGVSYPAGTGQYGYGQAIYVDNTADKQAESTTIGGGSTLTDEWLNRTPAGGAAATGKGEWLGQLYQPPGVSITLGQQVGTDTSGNPIYGIRLVRDDADWKDPANLNGPTSLGKTMDVRYDSNGLNVSQSEATSNNDIIIYAEGNIRLPNSLLSPMEGTGSTAGPIARHITIVTNGTAYIEGNLLKGSPDSSISVLAHDYVCVNTTQFLAGSNLENHVDGTQNPETQYTSLDAPGLYALNLDDGHSLLQGFSFGLTGPNTPNSQYSGSPLSLYLSAGPAGGTSTVADVNILDSTGTSVLSAPLSLTFGTLQRQTFSLSASSPLQTATGLNIFQLAVRKDPGSEGSLAAVENVALERVAVLPMDIRIEAILFAQTRSFFVIPGEWFNTNPDDTLDIFASGKIVGGVTIRAAGTRSDSTASSSLPAVGSLFPFYGQPIDMKITIDGSVSEAQPADVSAQTAWMLKWGWIPQSHGSQFPVESAGHVLPNKPAVGLQIIYNPQAGYPYNPTGTATNPAHYLRSDMYGRPLPFTPKLPVSTALLYSGESTEPPLLQ